jgi:hypothetical protein
MTEGQARELWFGGARETPTLQRFVTPRIAAQAFFLGRMARLRAIQDFHKPAFEPWQQALLARAIYSTYRDCRDLGVADEAQSLL